MLLPWKINWEKLSNETKCPNQSSKIEQINKDTWLAVTEITDLKWTKITIDNDSSLVVFDDWTWVISWANLKIKWNTLIITKEGDMHLTLDWVHTKEILWVQFNNPKPQELSVNQPKSGVTWKNSNTEIDTLNDTNIVTHSLIKDTFYLKIEGIYYPINYIRL